MLSVAFLLTYVVFDTLQGTVAVYSTLTIEYVQ